MWIRGIQTGEVGKVVTARPDLVPEAVRNLPQHVEQLEEEITVRMRLMQEKFADRPEIAWRGAFQEVICFHRYGRCDFRDECAWGVER